jgi:hypothetical protein
VLPRFSESNPRVAIPGFQACHTPKSGACAIEATGLLERLGQVDPEIDAPGLDGRGLLEIANRLTSTFDRA